MIKFPDDPASKQNFKSSSNEKPLTHDTIREYSFSYHSRRVLYVSPLGCDCPDYESHWIEQGFYVLRAFNASEAIPLIMTHHFEKVLLAEENTTADKAVILDLVDQLGIPIVTRNRYRDQTRRSA